MHTFILMIIFLSSNSGGIALQEFSSIEKCEQAKLFFTAYNKKNYITLDALCSPK